MALVSCFELLLKPQLPADVTSAIPPLAPLSRVILQGYFLTISNIARRDLSLTVSFQTRTPGLNSADVLCFFDGDGSNIVLNATTNSSGPGRTTAYSFDLAEADTALILLQPNITNQALFTSRSYESRGFVELFAQAGTNSRGREVLVCAEHRGTFFDASSPNPSSLGEVAYALPLAERSALIRLDRPD